MIDISETFRTIIACPVCGMREQDALDKIALDATNKTAYTVKSTSAQDALAKMLADVRAQRAEIAELDDELETRKRSVSKRHKRAQQVERLARTILIEYGVKGVEIKVDQGQGRTGFFVRKYYSEPPRTVQTLCFMQHELECAEQEGLAEYTIVAESNVWGDEYELTENVKTHELSAVYPTIRDNRARVAIVLHECAHVIARAMRSDYETYMLKNRDQDAKHDELFVETLQALVDEYFVDL